ncbi:hypothetical protein TWF481_009805 [Arthrobotrys musiformis]|uniref:Uncharacterized protein n=1 Tax=Arthrobotrys musiformis TaxID=47236 RepID=A0AAV9W705_9PEZI
MKFLSPKYSHLVALVLGLSARLVRGETIQLTVEQFDTLVQAKFWELHGLYETLTDIIGMVTEKAIFQPGATGSTQWPSLDELITRSAAGIADAGQHTAGPAPQSATIADELADLVRDVPNLQVTLLRDAWRERNGQPYAQNLWDRTEELDEYLTEGGEVNIESASSLLTWVFDATFDPIVGIYTLDIDKKDSLILSAGGLSARLADVGAQMAELEFAYRTSLNGLQDRMLARLAGDYLGRRLSLVSEFVDDYSGVFRNLQIVIGDVSEDNNPRGLLNWLQTIPVQPGGHTNVQVTFGSFGL